MLNKSQGGGLRGTKNEINWWKVKGSCNGGVETEEQRRQIKKEVASETTVNPT